MLIDMKLDLQMHIDRYKHGLKKGKKELEQIDANKHTEDIILLQKARLDRQIEQFEELQKILVKV
jgi:hypothetical protein